MKVLLINGSPHSNGNTFTALNEIAKTLKEEEVDSEIISIGAKAVQGCIACRKCTESSMSTSVAVSHDYSESRAHKSFFRENCMAYTVLSNIKEIFDSVSE